MTLATAVFLDHDELSDHLLREEKADGMQHVVSFVYNISFGCINRAIASCVCGQGRKIGVQRRSV